MNKQRIYLIIAIILGIMVFVHYELVLERNNRIIMFCETNEAKTNVAPYGPDCYHLIKTIFK